MSVEEDRLRQALAACQERKLREVLAGFDHPVREKRLRVSGSAG